MTKEEELKYIISIKFRNGVVKSNDGYGYILHYFKDKLYCDHVSSGLLGAFYIENKDYWNNDNIYETYKHFLTR